MEQVGVEAVVKGLQQFISDTGKMNNALQGIRGEGTLLQRAFRSISDGIANFGQSIRRVVEVALGVLLRDAINAAIEGIKQLISMTVEAANEFQTLEIRLERLNFNSLIESGVEYNKASQEAVKLTQEQLKWLQLLAAQSPYDSTDVANTFTLARSYGFAAEEAQKLTEDILDFASGMGLGAVEIERIIVNFGQLQAQGKLVKRELNDLARGAFVPVNDVLKVMSEQTGVAMEEMDEFRKTAESVPAFFEAFSTLVEKRFSGATEQMSKTFKSATGNIADLVKGIFGLNAVKPIFDAIGTKAAEFADAFTGDPEKWDRLVAAASDLGEALSNIVRGVFGLLPSTDSLAESVIAIVENIADWVTNNQKKVIDFFKGIGGAVREYVIPFIQEKLIPAFQRFSQWVEDNRETFMEFFGALGNIVKEFISDLFGGREGKEEAKGFGDIIISIMEYVIENQEAITKWVEVLWSVFVVWQVIGTVMNVVGGIIISVIGFILSITAAVGGFLAAVEFAIPVIIGLFTALTSPISLLIIAIIALAVIWKRNAEEIRLGWQFVIDSIKLYIDGLVEKFRFFVNIFKTAKEGIMEIGWKEAGANVIRGIIDGIKGETPVLKEAVINAAKITFEGLKNFLGMSSPSKLFEGVGINTMLGMANGIQKATDVAVDSMIGAMAQVTTAAVPSVTNSTVNNTSNFNLTVNSSAAQEPIVQDFEMMQSLAGG